MLSKVKTHRFSWAQKETLKKINSLTNSARNYKNVEIISFSSTSNRIIEYQITQNSAERKRGRIIVPEREEKDGRHPQKIRDRTEKVLSRAEEDNSRILKSERTNIFERSKER